MSLSMLYNVFGSVKSDDAWLLQLLKIKNPISTGVEYISRAVALIPNGKLTDFINEMICAYTSASKGKLGSYSEVRDYDGTTINNVIYKISADNSLINDAFKRLQIATTSPDCESDPVALCPDAQVLVGDVFMDDCLIPIKFISVKKPISVLKHKFLKAVNSFEEINQPVLTLHPTLDAIIVGSDIYMLSLDAEKIFNMERAYKAECLKKIDIVRERDIVSDFSKFEVQARQGFNPRRFVGFNQNRLNILSNPIQRKELAQLFGIPLDNDKFDTRREGVSDQVVKLLCDKGMFDPFENNPVEVSASKKWERF